jgi:hypothetical protein
MITNLQFAGVAAYLLWCLCASVSDRLGAGAQDVEPTVDESDKTVPVA